MADLSPSSRRGWPARLVEIADLIGDAAALRLVAAFGGLRIYIPAQPKPDQALWQAVGESAAHLLAERYGSAEVEIPSGAALRSKKIAILAARCSGRQIARDIGATERYVRKVRNAGKLADERQADLFRSK